MSLHVDRAYCICDQTSANGNSMESTIGIQNFIWNKTKTIPPNKII